MKRLRNYLKIVLIGFFTYRDICRKIAAAEMQRASLIENAEMATNQFLNYTRNEAERLGKNDISISKTEENHWLITLEAFCKDVDYLKRTGIIDDKKTSDVFCEIEHFRHLVTDFNFQLEKKKLRQQLIKLRNQIVQSEREFDSLYNSDRYFSKKELGSWKNKWLHLIHPIEEAIRKGAADVDFSQALCRVSDAYKNGNQLVEIRNERFIEEELIRFKDFFDNVEPQPLNKEQREAIVLDEANNLIVAGAGSGKTSTIIGKAKYLVKKGLANPNEILLIAFNKHVVLEMQERLQNRFGVVLPVKTYHSLGLKIVSDHKGIMPTISKLAQDRALLSAKISNMIRKRMADESFAQLFKEYFLFFSSPYKSAFDFSSYGEYFNYLKKYDIRSLKGDEVRSFEECYIANFLYSNGIDYLYEEPYEAKTADINHPQYRPDFFLPRYRIYIEHFGVNREGKTAPFVPQREYLQKMDWKRKIHQQNKTTLIETYSYEKQEATLLSNLEKELREKGVIFNPIPEEQIFDKLNEMRKIHPFSLFLSNFLNLYKSCSRDIEELKKEKGNQDRRTMVFLQIFEKIYLDYSSYLKENEEIDFNDMLIEATNIVKQGKWLSNFKYILVDEFQDISLSRYLLLKAIVEQNNAKLFCVGDDWQSIYRFTGSDLSIMVDFERNFGDSEIRFLKETFRFDQKLCDFSTKFILENPMQLKKRIESKKIQDAPTVTIVRNNMQDGLRQILTEISQKDENRERILIIGRYNWSRPESLQEIMEEYPQFEIKFTTAHRSKGREAEYAIIVGLEGGEYGFPCQIRDDPILNLVLAKDFSFQNAEERRLFYVSITRAKKHVFLLVDEKSVRNISTFVEEIQRNCYEFSEKGSAKKKSICPVCKSGETIQPQSNSHKPVSCLNPFCDYTESVLSDATALWKLFGTIEPGTDLRQRAEKKIWDIGQNLGFDSFLGFEVTNLSVAEENRFINVIWKSGDRIVAGFDVAIKNQNQRIVPTLEEAASLLRLQANEKYIVNVLEKTGKAYFHRVTTWENTNLWNKQQAVTAEKDKDIFHSDRPALEQVQCGSEQNLPTTIISDPSELSRLFGVVESGKGVQKRAEMRIWKIGKDLGYNSYIEYEVPNLLNDGRNRFINVVWKTGKEIVVAFEIRRRRFQLGAVRSLKDRRKLDKLQSKEKYIVNISEQTGNAHFLRVTDWENKDLWLPNSGEVSLKQASRNIQEKYVPSLEEIRLKHARAYATWTNVEDTELISEYREGLSIRLLAEKHQRQRGAIRARLIKLGLISRN